MDMPNFKGFWPFLQFKSLDFFDYTHCEGNDILVAKKSFFGPKYGQKIVFALYLDIELQHSFDIAYSDFQISLFLQD